MFASALIPKTFLKPGTDEEDLPGDFDFQLPWMFLSCCCEGKRRLLGGQEVVGVWAMPGTAVGAQAMPGAPQGAEPLLTRASRALGRRH